MLVGLSSTRPHSIGPHLVCQRCIPSRGQRLCHLQSGQRLHHSCSSLLHHQQARRRHTACLRCFSQAAFGLFERPPGPFQLASHGPGYFLRKDAPARAAASLWLLLGAALPFTRLGASASAAALLLVELVYVGLHFKPLEPLLPGSAGVADRGFLRAYTSAAFFASELALLLLLGTAQPFRGALPSAVLWVHAGFHLLYTALAWASPRWCVQTNIARVESAASPTTLAGAWAWLLNALNAADLALHAGYACLLALLVWRLVQPLAARLALLAGVGALGQWVSRYFLSAGDALAPAA